MSKEGSWVFGLDNGSLLLEVSSHISPILKLSLHLGTVLTIRIPMANYFRKISLSEVRSIENSSRDHTLGFQLQLKDGSILHHRLQSTEDRNRWIHCIQYLKDSSTKLFVI